VLQERDRVCALAYRITGNVEELDDLVQDIFLQVYCEIGRFRFESQFSTWLTRVVINECRKKLRQRKRQKQAFVEYSASSKDAFAGVIAPSVQQQGRNAFLHKAVGGLSEKHRLVVILKYFGGHSCEEIADILGCKLGTVYSRLHNALRRLRDCMEVYDESV
jgi:RNA polymerase sigma-70 factor (ECF subfamily)